MTGLCLIIETPCAGDSGHRFLSSSPDLSESEIARIATEANRTAVGAEYISVSREARQLLKNATVREGTERIILSGVDVGTLTPTDIDSIKTALTELFSPLQALAETLDWQSSERSTVIIRSELRDWIDQPKFRDVPLITTSANSFHSSNYAASPRERRSFARPIVWAAATSAVAVLLIATAILVGMILSRNGEPEPVPPVPRGNAAFQELADTWGCSPEELGESLLRAANWDRREEAGTIGLDALLVDGEVLAIIEAVRTTDPPGQFLMSPAIKHEDAFWRLMMDRSIHSGSDAIALRRWLFDSWQKFLALKENASLARHFVDDIEHGDSFSKFIVSVPEVQFDIGTGEGFREPATPLFDRQDVLIYRALINIHQVMRDAGVPQMLIANGHVESDLSKFVAMLSESRNAISRMVGDSRNAAMNAPEVPAEGVGKVRDAYQSLEQFLSQLSAVDVRD